MCWETAIQNHVPHELLARVTSWDVLTSFVGMPLGQALAGLLTSRFGVRPVLTGAAAVLLVAGVAPLAVRGTRRLSDGSEPAGGQAGAPTSAEARSRDRSARSAGR